MTDTLIEVPRRRVKNPRDWKDAVAEEYVTRYSHAELHRWIVTNYSLIAHDGDECVCWSDQLAALCDRPATIARVIDRPSRAIHRWPETGLSWWVAEAVAVHLGVNPIEIWPSFENAGHTYPDTYTEET